MVRSFGASRSGEAYLRGFFFRGAYSPLLEAAALGASPSGKGSAFAGRFKGVVCDAFASSTALEAATAFALEDAFASFGARGLVAMPRSRSMPIAARSTDRVPLVSSLVVTRVLVGESVTECYTRQLVTAATFG